MSKITFNYANIKSTCFKNKTMLKKQVEFIFKKEKTRLSYINYVFCTDDFLLDINMRYLKHNTLTDIITFNLADKNQPVIGEIYISVERVKENAQLFNSSFKSELHRVIFHGALHLCGYKDKTKADSLLMRKKEDEYLKAIVSQKTVS